MKQSTEKGPGSVWREDKNRCWALDFTELLLLKTLGYMSSEHCDTATALRQFTFETSLWLTTKLPEGVLDQNGQKWSRRPLWSNCSSCFELDFSIQETKWTKKADFGPVWSVELHLGPPTVQWPLLAFALFECSLANCRPRCRETDQYGIWKAHVGVWSLNPCRAKGLRRAWFLCCRFDGLKKHYSHATHLQYSLHLGLGSQHAKSSFNLFLFSILYSSCLDLSAQLCQLIGHYFVGLSYLASLLQFQIYVFTTCILSGVFLCCFSFFFFFFLSWFCFFFFFFFFSC